MVSLGNIGQIARDLRGVGSRFAPVAGKLAPAYAAAKAAAPVIQGAAFGAGAAVGQAATQPVKGVLGWFTGLIPENLYSSVVFFAIVLYFLDFISGFDIARTAQLHLIWGFGSFAVLAATARTETGQRYVTVRNVIIAGVFFYTLIAFGKAETLLPSTWQKVVNLVPLLITGALYFIWVKIPGDIKGLPIVAIANVYAMPLVREYVLDSAGISYLAFVGAFILNRLLFPVPLVYSLFAFYQDSRTARKLLAIILIFYVVASLPQITAAYRSHFGASLTTEEQEVAQGIWARFVTNTRTILRFEWLRTPDITGPLYTTFGFGEPEKEPPRGIVLSDDPTMPKAFRIDKGDKVLPTMRIGLLSPLEQNRPIKVSHVGCTYNECRAEPCGTLRRPEEIAPNGKGEVLIYYNRPRTAECLLEIGEPGSYTAKFNVKYDFNEAATFSTVFMRKDIADEILSGGEDPAERLPPPSATYDNGPVEIKFGPVELGTIPVTIDLTTSQLSSSIEISVNNRPEWNGEISEIKKLSLRVPTGVELESGDYCDFVKEEGKANTYVPNDQVSTTDIGTGKKFRCGLTANAEELLGGAVWAIGSFDVQIEFTYLTTKTVSVKVEKAEKTRTV